jgi:histidyl-tRNA synthetase
MTRVNKKAFSAKAGLHGVTDIVTQTDPVWNIILKRLQKMGRTYGFQRVETPVLEELSVLEQFYQDDPDYHPPLGLEVGGKTMAVRPAMLPSVLRSYVQRRVFEDKPLSKWLYWGNVVRPAGEGRAVSDYEYGFEVLGTFTHLTEGQAIGAVWQLMQDLGLHDATIEITTVGDTDCQKIYSEVLADFLRNKKFELCDNCNEALTKRVFNVLRCNNLECQVITAEAPTILDFLDDNTQKSFTAILEALDELQIPYQLNPLYAGPAGCSRTNVVIKYKDGNDTLILGEGGYHDNLMKQVTGKALASFGFIGSLSTLEQAMRAAEVQVQHDAKSEVYLVPLGELASKKSLRLFQDLTAADVRVYDHFGTVGVKNQLKQAEENKSPIALIMGQKEAMDEMVILRDVKSGMQEVFSYDKIVTEVKKRLGK